MGVLQAALRATETLARQSSSGALVGGLAVSVRTEPRNTRDVDLAVGATDDERAEAVVRGFTDVGYGIVTVLEHEVSGRLATVRLRWRQDPAVLIDLLFASSGIEEEIVRDAEPLQLTDDVTVPVARSGHLIAMKLLSRDDQTRPQDRVDLAALVRQADPSELTRARDACALIRERGYGRGRDLPQLLDEALALWRPEA